MKHVYMHKNTDFLAIKSFWVIFWLPIMFNSGSTYTEVSSIQSGNT